MPTIEAEFSVWCSCGNGLCGQTSSTKGGIIVEPCTVCLTREYERGKDEKED
jgi:hypothetical protein